MGAGRGGQVGKNMVVPTRAWLIRGTPPAVRPAQEGRAWSSETGGRTRGAGGRHQAPAEGKETGMGEPQDTQETRAKEVGRSSSQGSEKALHRRGVWGAGHRARRRFRDPVHSWGEACHSF